MSSSETTDPDALESSESETTSTDLEGPGTSGSGYSGSSDTEYSEYSVCFDSSSSDAALPDWDEACDRARRDPVISQRLNRAQRNYVSGWGNSMLCRTGMLGRVKKFLNYDFPVMSDCSGAEGGILALQALGIKVDHISSSEINCIATDFLAHNFRPRVFYPDVCNRKLQLENYRSGALIAGFPCQPFSVLRRDSDLLDEEAAKPFFAIVKTIGELRVPIYILENVRGIKRCLGAVNEELHKLRDYYHAIMEIDAKEIGDVVSRPRLYFIGVLRSVAAPEISSNAKLQNAVNSILTKAKRNCTPPTPWHKLLLDDSDAVQEPPIKRRRQTQLDLRYEKLGLAFD
ncbi:nlaIVM [Symbiodinium sp. CCMP2592]|nr:nlaIVM [Symbiodinium sp. CCMP2592]